MRNTLDKLGHMAYQIDVELAHQQPGAAVEATCCLLWHFWDPAMRKTIVAHLAEGGEGRDPVARDAIARLATRDAA